MPERPYIESIKTDLTPEFGESSWRDIQSFIDLAQNHFDALQISNEQKYSQMLGITETYKPDDPLQMKVHFLMERLKYFPDNEDLTQNAYQQLQIVMQQAEEYGIDLGDNLAQLYAKAKEAHLPVMSTFEVIKRNGKTVGFLMEDLTDGGKNFVFNAKNLFITLPEEKGYFTGIEDPFPGSREQLPENQRHLLDLFCQNVNLSPNSPLLAESLGLARKSC